MRRHRRPHSPLEGWLSSPFAMVLTVIAFALILAGCGERAQDQGPRAAGQTVTRDTPPWKAGATPFTAAGNTQPADKAAWDDGMKQRTQFQNEYVRIGSN